MSNVFFQVTLRKTMQHTLLRAEQVYRVSVGPDGHAIIHTSNGDIECKETYPTIRRRLDRLSRIATDSQNELVRS